MDKTLARQLLPLVNDIHFMDLLKLYVDDRIRDRKKQLESCQMTDLNGHQEAIRELRKYFCDMRNYVISKAE